MRKRNTSEYVGSNEFKGSELEDFLVVLDLYDGPMRGIVFFRGQPHVFERYEDPTESYLIDKFCLSPLQADLRGVADEAYKLALKTRVTGGTRTFEEETHLLALIEVLYPIQVEQNKSFDCEYELYWPDTWQANPITDQWKVQWLSTNSGDRDTKA